MEIMDENGKILATCGIIDNFSFYYFLEYFPTKYKVEEKYEEIRQIIWNFKNGTNPSKLADVLKKSVPDLKLSGSLKEWYLCIIPASTKDSNIIRFKLFCSEFCKGSPLNNGFTLIEQDNDRKAVHLQDDRGSIDNSKDLSIGDVVGKKILLFDDIYTTGNSFKTIADKLIQKGAFEVVGFFLGKTHWKAHSI